jgi:hypothetical protein
MGKATVHIIDISIVERYTRGPRRQFADYEPVNGFRERQCHEILGNHAHLGFEYAGRHVPCIERILVRQNPMVDEDRKTSATPPRRHRAAQDAKEGRSPSRHHAGAPAAAEDRIGFVHRTINE